MSTENTKLSREEIALMEIGQTSITRPMVWTLVAAFLLTIYTVPVVQNFYELRKHAVGARAEALPQCYDIFRDVARAAKAWPGTSGPFYRRVYDVNALLLGDIHRYEDALEDASWLTHALLSPTQYILTGIFGAGNEKSYPGLDGWLFYRPDVDYVTGTGFLGEHQMKRRMGFGTEWRAPPQPDPVKAIVQFHDQLQQRGIGLIVMPTPGKAVIHPEKFVRRYELKAAALHNPSYRQFVDSLRQKGLLVFDVSDELAAARAGGAPQFLATDTHWRPDAVERTAARLSEFIDQHVALPKASSAGYTSTRVDVANLGDVAAMLKLPPTQRLYPQEQVSLRQILTPRNELWHADTSADVLFLGDSFGNIYSLGVMGWGEAAGLAEQLSFELQRPLDRMIINDNASFATRAALARELARGRDRLLGKKLVIWQFADRELTGGDWKLIELNVGQPPPTQFVVPVPGSGLIVRGVIASISRVPRPGTVPYKDHVLSIHLVDVTGGSISNGQAVVYMMSMKDNVLTPTAQGRPGDTVNLRLRNWGDVSAQYDGINRSELDDADLQLQEPCWGEVVE
jgi:hypothetical protein